MILFQDAMLITRIEKTSRHLLLDTDFADRYRGVKRISLGESWEKAKMKSMDLIIESAKALLS